MDESRRFRLLIPVFWFLVFLVAGAWSRPERAGHLIQHAATHIGVIQNASGEGPTTADGNAHLTSRAVLAILGTLTAGGFLIFTFGYFILSVSVTILSLLLVRRLWKNPPHNWHPECPIGAEERKNLARKIGLSDEGKDYSAEHLFAAYHHGVLSDTLQEHFGRRWNFVMIGLNCVVAFILAITILLSLNLNPSRSWWAIAFIMQVPIVVHSAEAWMSVNRLRKMSLIATNLKPECGKQNQILLGNSGDRIHNS